MDENGTQNADGDEDDDEDDDDDEEEIIPSSSMVNPLDLSVAHPVTPQRRRRSLIETGLPLPDSPIATAIAVDCGNPVKSVLRMSPLIGKRATDLFSHIAAAAASQTIRQQAISGGGNGGTSTSSFEPTEHNSAGPSPMQIEHNYRGGGAQL
jgi:hypothetical protein